MKTWAYVGVGTITIIIFVMTLLSYFSIINDKKIRQCLFILIVLSMSFIAYSSYMGDNYDLYRYYQMINSLHGRSLFWAFQNFRYKNNVLTTILFWFVSYTGNNKLLPFFAVGITFSLIFVVLKKEYRLLNSNSSVVLFYIVRLFAVVTFQDLVGGVRQVLMLSVLLVTVYRDMLLEKNDILTILLYLACCMIHTGAVAFIVIRLCMFLPGKIKWFIVLWSSAVEALLPVLGFTNGFFGDAVERFITYRFYYERTTDWRFQVANIILALFLGMWMIHINNKSNNLRRYIQYFQVLLLFTIGAVRIPILFTRMFSACAFLSFPIISEYRDTVTHKKWNIELTLNYLVMAGMFIYQLVYIKTYWSFVD